MLCGNKDHGQEQVFSLSPLDESLLKRSGKHEARGPHHAVHLV